MIIRTVVGRLAAAVVPPANALTYALLLVRKLRTHPFQWSRTLLLKLHSIRVDLDKPKVTINPNLRHTPLRRVIALTQLRTKANALRPMRGTVMPQGHTYCGSSPLTIPPSENIPTPFLTCAFLLGTLLRFVGRRRPNLTSERMDNDTRRVVAVRHIGATRGNTNPRWTNIHFVRGTSIPRTFTSVLLVALLASAPLQRADAEPISSTALAVVGLTKGVSFVLRLAKSKADPSVEMLSQSRDMLRHLLGDSVHHQQLLELSIANDQAILEAIRSGEVLVHALHHRIDVLGETMNRQLHVLDELPAVIRSDVQQLLDQNRERKLRGIVATIDQHMRLLKQNKLVKDDLLQHWNDYLHLKNSLLSFHRDNNSFSALLMTWLYLFEERFWRALLFDADTVSVYRAPYVDRLNYEFTINSSNSMLNRYLDAAEKVRRIEGRMEATRNDLYRIVDTISRTSKKLGVSYTVFRENKTMTKQIRRSWKHAMEAAMVAQSAYNKLGNRMYGEILVFGRKWNNHRTRLSALTTEYKNKQDEYYLLERQYVQYLNLASLYQGALSALASFADYVDHPVPFDVWLAIEQARLSYGGR